jgi:hypothetical protein
MERLTDRLTVTEKDKKTERQMEKHTLFTVKLIKLAVFENRANQIICTNKQTIE